MFKQFIGWIFSPHVFEVMAFFLAAVGVAFMLAPTAEDIAHANWFFGAAFIFIIGRVAHWLITMRHSPIPKAFLAPILLAAIGVGWVAMYRVVQNRLTKIEPPKPFAIEVRFAFVSDTGPLTFYMVGHPSLTADHPSRFENAASPVFYLAYIQITNLQDVPSTISDFKIAGSKDPQGPWEDLVPIHLATTTLYALGSATTYPKTLMMGCGTARLATAMTKENMKNAEIVEAAPSLESEIAGSIPPHSTIRGWVALDSLRHAGLSPGQIYFRFKMLDAANKSGTYVAELPRRYFGDSSMDLNCGTIKVSGIPADISDFHVKYYADH